MVQLHNGPNCKALQMDKDWRALCREATGLKACMSEPGNWAKAGATSKQLSAKSEKPEAEQCHKITGFFAMQAVRAKCCVRACLLRTRVRGYCLPVPFAKQ